MAINPDRRYSEEEVARILEEAAEAQVTSGRSALPSTTGMTLAEIQEVAAEAGISKALVMRAATDLDKPRGASEPTKMHLGAPISVGRTIDLVREPTEREWDRLVVDLRETFDVPGEITEDGNFRQWQHESIEALLEPVDTGYRLRLRDRREQSKAGLSAGIFYGFLAPLLFVLLLFMGPSVLPSLGISAVIGAAGGAAYFGTLASTRKWAAERELQMEGIAGRLRASMARTDA